MRPAPFFVLVAIASACEPIEEGAPAELVVRLPDGDCHAGDETCALTLDDSETGVLRVRALDVVNVGDEAGSVVGVELAGDPSYVVLAEPDEVIDARGSSPFVVGLTPRSVGTLLATLVVVTELNGTIEIALSANAFASANEPSITPATCDFGDVAVGEVSVPCDVTVANDGTREMEISLFVSPPFDGQSVVVAPMFIQPGTAATIAFIASPANVGLQSSPLSYVIDGVTYSGSTTTFVVNGVAP